MTFYLTTSAGWGNISLALSDYVYKTDKPRVHKKLLDVVKCIDFHGLEFTDNEDEEAYEKRIAINSFTYNTIHSNLQDIVKPNEELKPRANQIANQKVQPDEKGATTLA